MPRVLIVEDSPTQAHKLALSLKTVGFETAVAADAEAGYARLTQEPFDAVVSDLMLPGEDGFALCRRIKADPQHRHLPVIIVTSACDPLNVLRGLEAGADDFMTKDHDAAEVASRLRRSLEHPPADRTAESTQVVFLGAPFAIAAGREQLLNVLLSAFEDVVHLNQRDEASLEELRRLSEQLRQAVRAEQQTLAHSRKRRAGWRRRSGCRRSAKWSPGSLTRSTTRWRSPATT